MGREAATSQLLIFISDMADTSLCHLLFGYVSWPWCGKAM